MLRAVKIRYYLSVMESMGYPASSILEGAGIKVKDLAAADYVIDVSQCKKIVSNMILLSGDQGIGFEIGSRMRMTDLGIFAYAMMSARTLRGAFDLWARYCSAFGMLIRLDLVEDTQDHWSLTINEVSPLGFLYNFCVEEALSITLNFGLALTGEAVAVKSVSLAYPSPSHEAAYHRTFNCPIAFNVDQTRITFSSPSLDQPLKTNDDELNAVCQAHCQQIMRSIEGSSPTRNRLREILLRNSSPLSNLSESAALLGISPRNLRRQLEREGVTYREIINELRIDLAKEYLASGELQPKEIGYLLGFKDPDAFRRAFKSWTGKTVSDYRVSAKHPSGS